MHRRAVIAGTGIALLHPFGGCLQRGEGADGAPLAPETRYGQDPGEVPIVRGGLAHGEAGEEDRTYYATLVTGRAGLDRFDFAYVLDKGDVDDGIVDFVRGTDFDEASLLVVQTFLRSGSQVFELEGVRRDADGEVHAEVTIPPTDGGTMEVVRATIYARLPLGGEPAPKRATITYTNNPYGGGGTTVFTADARDA